MDYIPRYAEGRDEIAKHLGSGKMKRKFHVVDGLEKAPQSLKDLFVGANTGKM